MEPFYLKPTYREQYFGPTKRMHCERFRDNYGTLNIFASGNGIREGTGVQDQLPSRPLSRRDTNVESTETHDFPRRCTRPVAQTARRDPVEGIRIWHDNKASQQHVQVVNIKPEYKDPLRMDPVRPLVRREPERTATSEVRGALAYAFTQQQMRGSVLEVPLGKPTPASRRSISYTRQERLCQAVRDHVQQRARGIANFYVQLGRDLVGSVTASTPRPKLQPWSLDEEPARPQLTLRRCLDQLVSLTSLPLTLLEFADLMWDMEDYKDIDDEDALEGLLSDLPVPFKDFADAFGANSNNTKLAVMKI
ncbi:hypothetical protein STCU_07250 [Strigomonas culicis]|uniref:Uncharacterized protein n=1 Tax=Strigomonas culicis TaxID=28005 RepID=S9U0L2_9TRYP|nr:hypothetical protein STCU_07250 [Strigomonas culicis]|eukprot:EPY24297.1 hypothetical protein STCU_07250 [Strigomonas culicis]